MIRENGEMQVRIQYEITERDGTMFSGGVNFLSIQEGWNRIGLEFNPSGSKDVRELKALAVGMLAVLQKFKDIEQLRNMGDMQVPEIENCLETALTHLEAATMFGVKGIIRADKRGD